LEARLRLWRRGGLIALAILAAVGLSLALARSPWVLSGLAGLPVLGYAVVHRDQRLIRAWEDRILERWGEGSFRLGIFAQGAAARPGPWAGALRNMLATLPPDPDFRAPDKALARKHRVLASARGAVQEIRLARSAARMAALCAGLATAAMAWAGHRYGACAAAGLLAVSVSAWVLLPFRTLAGWRNRTAALAAEGPEAPGAIAAWRAELAAQDWDRLPAAWRVKFLAALDKTSSGPADPASPPRSGAP
jgi:hypothetical protein